DKLGRVQVRFFWQDQDAASNWMRVQTPGAGTSAVIEKNRGFWFVPEIGDQVMVAFEQGDPSRPFVAGSLFHMNNTSGMVADNNIKAITTRSGHTIEFDDTDGAEKITIYDKEQSVIQFNTAEKSIKIQAMENVEIGAKNIKLVAEENLDFGAAKNITMAAEEALSLQSGKDTGIKAKGAATVEATKDLTLNGQNFTAEGKQNAEVKGGVQTSISGTMTSVQGGGGKVEVM
ncbi:phage baseplate assembly protein V, partial [Geofilum rhodophaeum]|uniref:phage baseplate assembly protein V n=1 Tax=Geofilum rhodophaeum TaxID=1965019 RepID=UPI00197A811D